MSLFNALKSIRFFFVCALVCCSSSASAASWQYGLSMYGDLKYPSSFTHFDYANPDAPKGGTFKRASLGSFDSFNAFIIKGHTAAGIGEIYDTLLSQSLDEPFSCYGLVAEAIKVADDFSAVSFRINKGARFHDGKSIHASDVKFSFDTLVSKGAPHYRSYYGDVEKVVVDTPLQVTFYFKVKGNRELPLIIGQLPVLPEHYWTDKDFSKTSLDIPLGSGPYKVAAFKAGKQVTYERVKDYWAQDLPINKGMNNFDKLIYDYYRDDSVAFEAFKSGAFDYRLETSSKRWATGYEGKQFISGDIITEVIADKTPQGLQGFWFNLRQDKFKDINVRKAISLMFDFEWTNEHLFYGAYQRSHSFFSGSELATGEAISAAELEILTPYKDRLSASVFAPLRFNQSGADGNIRPQMREAVRLLANAGYALKDSKMQDKDGTHLSFEFLLYSKAFERVVLPFVRNLARIGIKASIRLVDTSQFINRLNSFDFDIVSLRKGQSSSPGNEQIAHWGCDSAMHAGTPNWAGVCNPVIDELANRIVMSNSREELVNSTKALDRVLLNEYFVIPQWYLSAYRIAYWNKFAHPKIEPSYALGLGAWWSKEALDE